MVRANKTYVIMSQKNSYNCKVGKQTPTTKGSNITERPQSVMGKITQRYYDWDGFFNAIKKLGIKSQEDYKERFHQDPLLPEDPSTGIIDFPGWEKTIELLYK